MDSVSVPFSSLTNGYDWNAGGANLDLTQVKAFLFSGFVGSDNGGAKIDQFELYTTGDPETALGPEADDNATTTTEAPETTTTTIELTCPATTSSVETFESYGAGTNLLNPGSTTTTLAVASVSLPMMRLVPVMDSPVITKSSLGVSMQCLIPVTAA